MGFYCLFILTVINPPEIGNRIRQPYPLAPWVTGDIRPLLWEEWQADHFELVQTTPDRQGYKGAHRRGIADGRTGDARLIGAEEFD